MALSAAVVLEVRTTGSDTNGGGFKTGASGTDWSLQDTAQYNVADAVTAGTTTLTSATANFGTDVVGNLCYVQGGTGSIVAAWYEIISRTNSTTIVVDRSTGLSVGTGATLIIGGALLSPGQAAAIATVIGQKIYLQTGTYTLTTATIGAAGPVYISKGVILEGYASSRGDLGTKPIVHAGAITSITLVLIGGDQGGNGSAMAINIEANGNSGASNIGFANHDAYYSGGDCLLCLARNSTSGFSGLQNIIACTSISCTNGFNGIRDGFACYAKGGSWGFLAALFGGYLNHCVASGCSSGGIRNAYNFTITNCVTYNCGGTGFVTQTDGPYPLTAFVNCLAVSNSGYGFGTHSSGLGTFLNNATYNNTSGAFSTTPSRAIGSIILSADPFVDAANDNFNLNTTVGGGAACRAAGFPGTFPGVSTISYLDVGAAQHQDPSSGGGGGGSSSSGGLAHIIGS